MKKSNVLLLCFNLFSTINVCKGYVYYGISRRLITTYLDNNKITTNVNNNNAYNNDSNMRYSYVRKRYMSKKKSNEHDNEKYINDVMYQWVKQFVWGLQLCPFSGSVIADNKMNIKVINDDDSNKGLQNIFDYIIEESNIISISNKESKYTTTLVVLSSSSWNDFHNYLQLVEDVENLLTSTKLDESIQIATFHPNYVFAETDDDSVENFTNRSPYPCLHLLKVEEVTKAIESYGDTQNIYENNIKKMHSLGLEKIQQINEKIKNEALKK